MIHYLGYGERRYEERPSLPHLRRRWEFQMVLSGACRPSTLAHRRLPDGPRLHVMHPMSLHGWIDEPGGVSEVLVLHFSSVPPELADLISPREPLTVPLGPGEVRHYRKLGPSLLPLVRQSGPIQDLRAQRLLIDLSLLALEYAGSATFPDGKGDSRRITRSLVWFREHLNDSPSVERAARAVGCSASHLRRLYQRAGHVSPQSVLQGMRMESAAECLHLGWPQKKIADTLGFSELSAFTRAFRRHFGLPPGTYRRQKTKTRVVASRSAKARRPDS